MRCDGTPLDNTLFEWLNKKEVIMGKGDLRSKRGKIVRSTNGKSRPKPKNKKDKK
jgi:ribosomal small subunit protein bTHX